MDTAAAVAVVEKTEQRWLAPTPAINGMIRVQAHRGVDIGLAAQILVRVVLDDRADPPRLIPVGIGERLTVPTLRLNSTISENTDMNATGDDRLSRLDLGSYLPGYG